MIKKICIVIPFLIILCHAQVNIEQHRNNDNEGAFIKKEKINISTAISKNSESLYTISLKYSRNLKINTQNDGFIIAKVNYGKQNSTEYENNSFYHLRIINKQKILNATPEFYAQYENNIFSSTEYRYLAGSGLRYPIKKDITGGTSLLYETYKDSSKIQNNVRISQYLKLVLFLNKENKINSIIYAQPAINDINNMRIYSEIEYVSKITQTISYTSIFTLKYFSENSEYNNADTYFKSGLSFYI